MGKRALKACHPFTRKAEGRRKKLIPIVRFNGTEVDLGAAPERDFMEWEALAMERQELLDLIRELTAPVDAAS